MNVDRLWLLWHYFWHLFRVELFRAWRQVICSYSCRHFLRLVGVVDWHFIAFDFLGQLLCLEKDSK